ncbi:MAG TPA: ATP-binding cassette domain-containing protein, partial [Bacillota bacterium]|nr:ATP-binding cassette domain-containing protein [Bacillota bacterium]
MLKVANCSAGYDGIPALVDVSFHIDEGEIVTIVGSNGTGKSTIARLVSGLIKATSGTIEFRGKRIDKMPA